MGYNKVKEMLEGNKIFAIENNGDVVDAAEWFAKLMVKWSREDVRSKDFYLELKGMFERIADRILKEGA